MKERNVSGQQHRHDRLIHERVHDPYKTRLKLVDPTVCPQCGAVYESDRWHWGRRPANAHEELCQACHRMNDDYPAGEVILSGEFLAGHKEEVLHLARHQEELEKAEHPLHRIMSITDQDGQLVITTTDIHLPRRIGEALHRAYKGTFDVHYDEEGYFVRVRWSRREWPPLWAPLRALGSAEAELQDQGRNACPRPWRRPSRGGTPLS